jgi:hypothetical protein
MRLEINPVAMRRIRESSEQLAAGIGTVLQEVASEMRGEPAGQVLAELRTRMSSRNLPSNGKDLPRVAERISAGTWPTV